MPFIPNGGGLFAYPGYFIGGPGRAPRLLLLSGVGLLAPGGG
jgi:hypothetical protein